MLKQSIGIMAACLVLGLTSCSDDNPWMGAAGHGAIRLQVSTDGRVRDAVPETRAGSETLPNVPPVEDFSIKLVKDDGSFSKEYPRLADFQAEQSFPTGTYTLSALYGDANEMGFDEVAFAGSTKVTVLEGETAEAQVTATVAHSLISITYTDGFKNYLHSYSAAVHTDGHGYLDIPADAQGPAYVVPGKVNVAVTFSNQQNQSVTLQPAEFMALAGHHYHITMDVNNGANGVAQLQILFDDSVEQESVEIDLTSELFTSPGPTVTPQGFTDGQAVEFLAGEAPNDKYRFNVISHGGLKEVNLTINSTAYTPPFGKEINLIGASEEVQRQLEELGIECKGIFRNPDKMAIVDCSGLPKNLPAGEYEISLQAKDAFTRISDAVSFKFNAVAPHLEASGLSAIAGLNEGSVAVTYNGSNPEQDITFKAYDQYGNWVDAKVQSAARQAKTRAIESNTYVFTIKLPDTSRNPMPVKVYLYGQEMQQISLPVEQPAYSVAADALARKVLVKVTASGNQTELITQALNFFENGTKIAESRIVRESTDGMVTISGLNPGQSYTLQASLNNKPGDGAKSLTFTTETATDVTNGDFAATTETININPINAGGVYSYSFTFITDDYQNRSSIVVNTPNGWGNINNITCNQNSSLMNTWYVVPSTFVDPATGYVTVRTVGYNEDGPAIPKGSATLSNYYSRTAPDKSAFKVAAGQLFYGNSADGTSFNTRPSSMTFAYQFAPKNGETGSAKVVVYSGNTVIGAGKLNVSNTSGTAQVDIKYIDSASLFGKSATSIAIVFQSSSATEPYIDVPSGTDLSDNPNSALVPTRSPFKGDTLAANSYKSFASGSVLTIQNVKLNY